MLNKAMLMCCGPSGSSFSPAGEMFARFRITVGLERTLDANKNYTPTGGKGFYYQDLIVSGEVYMPAFGQSVTLSGERDLLAFFDNIDQLDDGGDLLQFHFDDYSSPCEYVAVLNETNGKFGYGQIGDATIGTYLVITEGFFDGIEEGQTCYVSIYEHAV